MWINRTNSGLPSERGSAEASTFGQLREKVGILASAEQEGSDGLGEIVFAAAGGGDDVAASVVDGQSRTAQVETEYGKAEGHGFENGKAAGIMKAGKKKKIVLRVHAEQFVSGSPGNPRDRVSDAETSGETNKPGTIVARANQGEMDV